VIACRNAADVLAVQLAALERQPCPVPWEVLICDNGSTDATVALAESWADRLPLRVIDAAGIAGAGPARNAGVRAARGEYLGFCDADDEVGDDWLVTLVRALDAHTFVAGRLEARRLNSPRVVRSRPLQQQTELQRSSAAVGLPHAGGGNLGIHRSVFLAVGGFDPTVRYLQDTDLCWRVQRAGHPLVFVPELVVHVRLRSTLRGMYRQGRNYGACQALLERRYAPAVPPPSAPESTVEPTAEPAVEPTAELAGASRGSTVGSGTAAPAGVLTVATAVTPLVGVVASGARAAGGVRRSVRGVVRLARHFAVHRSSLGEQVWQFGWHVGHRS
jgi:hypothetical protein